MAELKTAVRIDTKSAERNINRLTRRIDAMNNSINSVKSNQLSVSVQKAVTQTQKLDSATKQASNSASKLNKEFHKSGSTIDMLTTKVKRLANAYLGVMGAKALISGSDTITAAENKLNYLNAGQLGASGYGADGAYSQATLDATQETMEKMYTSAQKVRMGYSDMMANVAKSMTLAGGAFQNNTDNAIRFQEIMSEAYTLGGASAAEMSSSMYQMIQALGSGRLQGDELRSVREGAPLAYQKIEEFAKGVYGAEENLKDLASQGKITSDIVVAAIMDAGNEIDKGFAQTNMTFAQAFTKMKNTALMAFTPVLKQMNAILNSEQGQAFMAGLEQGIINVAKAITALMNIFTVFFNYTVENWYWIQFVVLGVLGAITVQLGIMAAQIIKTAATAVAAILFTPFGRVILAISLIIALIVYTAGSVRDACGFIAGVVMVLMAWLTNLIIAVLNGIILLVWNIFVKRWIGAIEFVLNVLNGGFNSFGDGVKNLIGNIISWFLSLGVVVSKIVDAIFGTNWTSGLESLKSDMLKWGKNENYITLDRSTPTVQSLTGSSIDYLDYGTMYDAGFNWGTSAYDKVGNFASKVSTGMNDKLGIGTFDSMVSPNYDIDKVKKGIGDTADNTGKMAKSMDLTEEDLSYLRQIAEMEWKKEFTTAEIKVDMSNYNTVNGDSDLDGLVTKLTSKLYEELALVADGAYA